MKKEVEKEVKMTTTRTMQLNPERAIDPQGYRPTVPLLRP